MEQHPIPQNVTQYQFHLIGDMTLKQFVILGAGIVLAIITFKAPFIPGIIQMPLTFIFGAGGAALAFLSFEERPLDIWLINFAKAIYSPTQYLWQKHNPLPDFFNYSSKNVGAPPPIAITQNDRNQLNSYLRSLQTQPQNPIDHYEGAVLNKINRLFNSMPQSPVTQQRIVPPVSQPTKPSTTINPTSQPAFENIAPVVPQPQVLPQTTNAEPPKPQAIKPMGVIYQENKSRPAVDQNLPPIPEPPKPQEISQTAEQPDQMPPTAPVIEFAPSLVPPIRVQSLIPPEPPKKKVVGPQYLSDIQMPMLPESPNVIVGMTITKDEHLIANTIIEIRDNNDIPIRTVKANQLGQFFIAMPLINGTYSIFAEHQDYDFDTIRFEAKGEIIPPIKVVATEIFKEEPINDNLTRF